MKSNQVASAVGKASAEEFNNESVVSQLLEAQLFAIEKHGKQTRRDSGMPYVVHVTRVANSVAKYYHIYCERVEGNIPLIELAIAALLHDTVEDTETELSEISHRFGILVATLVQSLTSDAEEVVRLGKGKYLTQKMNEMSMDALYIKLLDRLDNITDYANGCSLSRAVAYAKQTISIMEGVEVSRNQIFWPIISKIMDQCEIIIKKELNRAEADAEVQGITLAQDDLRSIFYFCQFYRQRLLLRSTDEADK